MKNICKHAVAAAICIAALPLTISCSHTGEPGGGEDGTIVVVDGAVISEIGDYTITYDNLGRPVRVHSNYSELLIDYNKSQIRMMDDPNDYYDAEVIDVKFKDGYISSFSQSWNYKEDYYQEKGSGKAEFKYSKGYLTQIKIESKGEEKEGGETYKWNESSDISMTWKGGDMVSCLAKYVEKDDDYTDNWSEEYTYTYGSEKNVFQQMPLCVSYCWFDDTELSILAALGLFGKGTATLPTALKEVYKEDGDTDTDNYSINITLNSNGSIYRESFGGSYVTYSYEDFYTRTEDNMTNVKFKPAFKALRHKKK